LPALRLLQYCAAAGLIVMLGLSIPQAKKARYLLPMLPMAAIIAAYPFAVVQGRWFVWLRRLMQGIWLLIPMALMAAVLVARQRLAVEVTHLASLMALLGLLQTVALAVFFRPQWRPQTLAFSAVLALWSFYMLMYEPLERQLYDTRTFSRSAFALVQQNPAPLVLHGMGKDAKAIKFMVNIEQDLQPLFTETIQGLESVAAPAWVMMDLSDYQALHGTALGTLQPVLSGRFDKNDVVLLHWLTP
jgi:hypothetical protein